MRKNNITKVVAIIMATALTFTGCGTNETARLTTSDAEKNSENTTLESEEGTSSVSLTKKDEGENIFSKKATIDETIISEEGGIIITAKELAYYEDYAELLIEIENTSDRTVEVYSETLAYAVNGINKMSMDFGYVNETINSGMIANAEMYIDADELRAAGMKDIASIVVGFDVCDEDNMDLFKTGPVEIKTSIYDEYDFGKDTLKEAITGDVWTNMGITYDYLEPDINLEQNGVSILLAALVNGLDESKTFLLEAKNDAERDYYMSISNVTVNGIVVCDGIWSSKFVGVGDRVMLDVNMSYLLDDYASLIDLDKIGQIAFDIECRDIDELGVIDTIGLEFAIDKSAANTQMQGETVYEEDGIKINVLDAYQDNSKYVIPLMVENGTEGEIIIDDKYDSLAINGVMTDYTLYSKTVATGQIGVMEIEVYDTEIEKLKISSPDEITSAQITLEITDGNYNNKKTVDIAIEK